jgi:hypothetical protein
MNIPNVITAGDTPSWLDASFADGVGASVDSSAYVLTYYFRGADAAAKLDLTGTASGSGWQFTLGTAASAAFNTGSVNTRWNWVAVATKASVRITAGEGVLIVKPNLANITTYDGRSAAEQVLATVEAAILARTNGDMVTEYTIGSRSLKKEPMTALLELRSRYRLIVSRERKAQAIKNGLGNPTRLGVRFRP